MQEGRAEGKAWLWKACIRSHQVSLLVAGQSRFTINRSLRAISFLLIGNSLEIATGINMNGRCLIAVEVIPAGKFVQRYSAVLPGKKSGGISGNHSFKPWSDP
jgi:hypothetical protein